RKRDDLSDAVAARPDQLCHHGRVESARGRVAMTMRSEREHMVSTQLNAGGIDDARGAAGMGAGPGHLFVSDRLRECAYSDQALPIGDGQTISQPYIVAMMSAALDLRPGERVLEIGTGSGYQAAVLGELGVSVFSVERLENLATAAR